MSEHRATIDWKRTTDSFAYDDYNREHEWRFGSGIAVKASAAPAFRGDGQSVDPEEAFVAAVSSCHMLTFLALCAKKRIVVDAYEDAAVGLLAKNENGKLAITEVRLSPNITFAGEAPDEAALAALHERAHHECFIANSVSCQITTP
ncbi:OsmC family peroxiredoxin [Marinihelvus fidelis]|uniref:OsmC family peroxiredoxin n=1 Tax=Marinihelvus fidelis TaxID=2613842 RepID=A0A5N0T594_9GAMM|nr:OsmC family protein [Marinihelvus fidelis]KAA9130250.1 OsmC family peroxiredoxin [Marinihelvus fidelis]